MMYQIAAAYFLLMNLVTFMAFGADKFKAKKGRRRISELSLLLLAAFGGSVGALFGMKVFHHKTLHKKFKYGVPVILALQIALAVYLICFV